jgi:predicted MFS family arabinose efflux permease
MVALARAKEGLHPEPPDTIDKKAINPAFHDIRIYFYALLYACALFPSIALLYFIPVVLTEIGFVEMPGVALMLVPPLASSFITMIVMARMSDRMRDRGRFIGGLCVLGAVGNVLLLTIRRPGLRYFSVFLVAWGTLYAHFRIDLT